MTAGLKDFSRSYFFLGDRLEKFSPLLKGADLNLGIDKSSVKISISKLWLLWKNKLEGDKCSSMPYAEPATRTRSSALQKKTSAIDITEQLSD